MKKNKILIGFLCVMFMASIFSGFTLRKASSKKADSTELTFMGWGQPSEQAIFAQTFKKFEAANPNITVKYINVDPGQFGAKLSTMIAAGKAPDVFYVQGGDFMKYVKSGILANITPMLATSTAFKKDDVWSTAMARWTSDGKVSGKGDQYALPKDVGPYPMVYNKTLMKKCGVTPPDPKHPWTWDQFLSACKKMTKDTNGDGKLDTYGCAFIPNEAAIWSNGGSWLSKDKKKVTIDTPQFVKGLQLLSDITNKYHYAPNASENSASSWWNRWLAGNIGIAGMGPWDQPTFWTQLKFDWDIAQWPMDAKLKISKSWLGSMGIGVSAKTEHAKEAFDLASYITLDADAQRSLYQMGQSVPNLMSMAKGEFLKMAKGPKSRFVFLDYIEKYSAPDVGSGNIDNKWLDTFNQDLTQVTTGKVSPAAWVKTEQPKLQKLYEDGGNVPQ